MVYFESALYVYGCSSCPTATPAPTPTLWLWRLRLKLKLRLQLSWTALNSQKRDHAYAPTHRHVYADCVCVCESVFPGRVGAGIWFSSCSFHVLDTKTSTWPGNTKFVVGKYVRVSNNKLPLSHVASCPRYPFPSLSLSLSLSVRPCLLLSWVVAVAVAVNFFMA